MLLSRLTTTQRNAIVQPAFGLLILNTTKKCLETNIGSPDMPNWKCLTTGIPVLSDADTMYWNRKLGAGDTLSISNRINGKLTATDTVSLSNRINSKLNPSDTLSLSSRIEAKLSSFTESDPLFNGSVAKGITASDTLYWNRKLGAGDTLSLSNRINGKLTATDTVSLSNRINAKLSPTDTLSLSNRIDRKIGLPPSGNSIGDMLFWDGSSWVKLPTGQNGQMLQLINGLPTWAGAAFASLTTNTVTGITGSTATVGGNITSDGGGTVTARGVVYGTTPSPVISHSILSIGSGTGAFSGTISGLSPNTTYYVRSFATNSAGTAYGNEVNFTTGATVPTISTSAITTISNNSAVGGGNVTSDGGSPVTARGLVYGPSSSPTLSNSVLNIGSGTGAFSGTISGLSPNTTYYVRSFATNSTGTAYGNEVSFTNLCGAFVASGVWKNFMCHNLGAANTSADPFTPSWEINGGYWQWGRKEMVAAGPSGSGAGQANDGAIVGWNTTRAPNDSWSDANKTSNDPCPAGFRVPTRTQWQGLISNNAVLNVGGSSWTNSTTNYSTGKRYGENLFLPAAGWRYNLNGSLFDRGAGGSYWSSTASASDYAWYLHLNASLSVMYGGNYRTDGFPIRCIAE
jgi:uncharacterized protein (TIGR02145 family)